MKTTFFHSVLFFAVLTITFVLSAVLTNEVVLSQFAIISFISSIVFASFVHFYNELKELSINIISFCLAKFLQINFYVIPVYLIGLYVFLFGLYLIFNSQLEVIRTIILNYSAIMLISLLTTLIMIPIQYKVKNWFNIQLLKLQYN